MLYLAEVKGQTRAFVTGAYRTELRLLAAQTAEQTWNPMGGEEVVVTEAINEPTTRGTLYILNLDAQKQLLSQPELAGQRIVNYLRHFSRVLEKTKAQEEEIEAWKNSLRIQGEEIARRQAELDLQQQLIQQQKEELARLEEEKEKLAGAWEQLRQQQAKNNENKALLRELITKVQQGSYSEELQSQSLAAIETQTEILEKLQQRLSQEKAKLAQKQEQLAAKEQELAQKKAETLEIQQKLQQALLSLQLQQQALTEKEEALKYVVNALEVLEGIRQDIVYLMDEEQTTVDCQQLENMPIVDLEERFNNLKQETDKLVEFVNMQEEELALQAEEVREIRKKLAVATERERPSLEEELADAQESLKMLNETLVGQRKNLRKQQRILNEHLKILSRRKGIVEVDFRETISLKPLKEEVELQKELLGQKREQITAELAVFRENKAQLEAEYNKQQQLYSQAQQQQEELERQWRQLYGEVIRGETVVTLLEESLPSLQACLQDIRESVAHTKPPTEVVQLLREIEATL